MYSPPQAVIAVRLLVRGFSREHHAITEHLGLSPTLTWRRGDLISPLGGTKRESTGWVVEGEASDSLLDAIDDLLQKVAHAARRFSDLPEGEVVLDCSVEVESRAPALQISRSAVRILAEMGAMINIDYVELGPSRFSN